MKGVDTETGLGCIGFAVEQLRAGEKVTRKGWNGKGLYLIHVPELKISPLSSKVKVAPFLKGALAREHILLFASANGEDMVSTWSPSISDTLAEDWCIV